MALTTFGCATFSTKNYSQYSEGIWQAKALVKDKRNKKSGIVNIKIQAVVDQKLRLDVTSPIGTHLATVVVVGDQVEYLSVQEKTLYKTKANKETLTRLLKLPLETSALYNVLFDKTFSDKNWSCVTKANNLPESCKNLKSRIDIEWDREGAKRNIEISSAAASVQMSLSDFESKISQPEKVFSLTAPSSFRVKNL